LIGPTKSFSLFTSPSNQPFLLVCFNFAASYVFFSSAALSAALSAILLAFAASFFYCFSNNSISFEKSIYFPINTSIAAAVFDASSPFCLLRT
jgi:hypothetical protein